MYAWWALSMARTGHVWLLHVASCCVMLRHVALRCVVLACSPANIRRQIIHSLYWLYIDLFCLYFISWPSRFFSILLNSSQDKPHEHGSHLRASSTASSWKGLIMTQTHTQKRSSVSVHCVCLYLFMLF